MPVKYIWHARSGRCGWLAVMASKRVTQKHTDYVDLCSMPAAFYVFAV